MALMIYPEKLVKDLKGIKDMLVAAGDPFLASVINRAIGCVGNQEAVAAVPVEDIEKWLWQIALNNTGITQDISDTCEMIIDRLDGLRTFSRERKYND